MDKMFIIGLIGIVIIIICIYYITTTNTDYDENTKNIIIDNHIDIDKINKPIVVNDNLYTISFAFDNRHGKDQSVFEKMLLSIISKYFYGANIIRFVNNGDHDDIVKYMIYWDKSGYKGVTPDKELILIQVEDIFNDNNAIWNNIINNDYTWCVKLFQVEDAHIGHVELEYIG